MFERFTTSARAAVAAAQEEARTLHHGWIGTEHLLLGILRERAGTGWKALDDLGLRLDDVRAEVIRRIGTGTEDAELLETIGIDLDEVRRHVEDVFGPGALDRGERPRRPCSDGRIPFTRKAKKALELGLRESVAMGHGEIRTEHLVLGLARDGVAAEILAARGATLTVLRSRIAELGSQSGPAA